MLTPVLILFLASALAPLAHRALGKRAGVFLAAAPALLFAHFARFLAPSASGHALEESWPWVAGLGIRLAFRLDGLSLLFALLVTGIGALVLVYGGGYLKGDPRLPRFYAAILFFMAAMLGLVLADDAIALFVFWELTSVSSYLLIGFDHEQEKARKSALQALFVTGAGGLALLAGLLLLGPDRGHAAAVGPRRAGGRDPGPPALPPRAPPRAARGLHEVGPVPLPLLAAGGDGRPEPGERLPALGHDGEGGDLPPRPPQPRPRRDGRLALPRHPRRHRDARHRRRPRLRPDRPQAPARLHDGERPRDADAARGHLDRALGPGGDGVPARPRPLQSRPLPRGGGDRPRGGHARRAPPRRPRPGACPSPPSR